MRVLIFETKRLSYDSSYYFMEMLRRGMERMGVEVTVCCLEEVEQQEQELESFCGQHWDAVIDVNSILPRLKMDEAYYLDCLDAPFYHMIVDHPMHLHETLRIPLKRYYVVCLDRYHAEYLRRQYSHLSGVHCLGFAGIEAGEFADAAPVLPMKQRPIRLLFPGTFTPLSYYKEQMEAHTEGYAAVAQEILQAYHSGSRKPLEELFVEKTESDGEFLAMKMYKARYIDKYIREWYRQSIWKALLAQGVEMDVVGFRWEMVPGYSEKQLRRHKPCSYATQLQMLGQSRMVLNIQPSFMDGVHDRVMNAMLNRSVVVTDGCEYLEDHYDEEQEYLRFDRNRPEEMARRVRTLLEDTDRLEEIAENARKKASAHDTWYQRAGQWVSFIREDARQQSESML